MMWNESNLMQIKHNHRNISTNQYSRRQIPISTIHELSKCFDKYRSTKIVVNVNSNSRSTR